MSRVKVTCFYNNKRWIVTVNETKTMYDILDYMVQHKYIPTGLGVRQLKDSPWYPNIHEGSELEFYDPSTERFDGVLYGCPTSKDMPGIVPNCMLSTFDGFVLSEILDEEANI